MQRRKYKYITSKSVKMSWKHLNGLPLTASSLLQTGWTSCCGLPLKLSDFLSSKIPFLFAFFSPWLYSFCAILSTRYFTLVFNFVFIIPLSEPSKSIDPSNQECSKPNQSNRIITNRTNPNQNLNISHLVRMYSDHFLLNHVVWFGLQFLSYQSNQSNSNRNIRKTLIKHMLLRPIFK